MATVKLEKRRRHLPEFRDLFTALFKIPDADVQSRVLKAINGVIDESYNCKCFNKIETIEVGTQTEPTMVVLNAVTIKKEPEKVENVHQDKVFNGYYGDDNRYVQIDKEPLEIREIRSKRKRNRRFPKAEKVKAIDSKGYIKQNGNDSEELTNESSNSEPFPKIQKYELIEELNRFVENEVAHVDTCYMSAIADSVQSEQDIIEVMEREFQSCLVQGDGLLPIHYAIIQNDIQRLHRQIYIFNYLKRPINSLLTSEHDNPLQLAIKNDCCPNIIKTLLDTKPDIYEKDDDENNIFHLIMQHTNEAETLQIVLKHYPNLILNVLSSRNNDGYTPLHICVKLDKPMMLKTLLEYINERFGFENAGRGITNENKLVEIYSREINQFYDKKSARICHEKMIIINKTDVKHGSTALLLAIKKKSKLLSLMLLANLADPKIKDYSETDCQSFANECYNNRMLVSQIINTSIYLERCNYSDKQVEL